MSDTGLLIGLAFEAAWIAFFLLSLRRGAR